MKAVAVRNINEIQENTRRIPVTVIASDGGDTADGWNPTDELKVLKLEIYNK